MSTSLKTLLKSNKYMLSPVHETIDNYANSILYYLPIPEDINIVDRVRLFFCNTDDDKLKVLEPYYKKKIHINQHKFNHKDIDSSYHSDNSGYQADISDFHSDNTGYQSDNNGYQSDNNGYQSDNNGYQSDNTGYQSDNNGYQFDRDDNTGYQSDNTGYQSDNTGYQSDSNVYQSDSNVYQSDRDDNNSKKENKSTSTTDLENKILKNNNLYNNKKLSTYI